MGVDLLSYYPDVLNQIMELIALTDSENPEFDLIAASLESAESGMFVATADGGYLTRWENIVGVTPKSSDDVQTRRFRVMSKLVQPEGYTEARLSRLINGMLGEGCITFKLDYIECILWLYIHKLDPAYMPTFYEMIDDTIPANLAIGTAFDINLSVKTSGLAMADTGILTGTHPGMAAMVAIINGNESVMVSGYVDEDGDKRTSGKLRTGTNPGEAVLMSEYVITEKASVDGISETDDNESRTGKTVMTGTIPEKAIAMSIVEVREGSSINGIVFEDEADRVGTIPENAIAMSIIEAREGSSINGIAFEDEADRAGTKPEMATATAETIVDVKQTVNGSATVETSERTGNRITKKEE